MTKANDHQRASKMKVDLCMELDLWNKNADEMIRLLQNIQTAGVWSRQECARHEARFELLRTKLKADFRELMAMRGHADAQRLSERNRHPLAK